MRGFVFFCYRVVPYEGPPFRNVGLPLVQSLVMSFKTSCGDFIYILLTVYMFVA